MNLLVMGASFFAGAFCMWLIYEAHDAPELIEWHRVGNSLQKHVSYDIDKYIKKN